MGYNYVASCASSNVFEQKSGDKLVRLIIIPTNASHGNVQIQDGAASAMTVYVATGSTSPVSLELNIHSTNTGGWTIITGTAVTCFAVTD